MQLGGCADLLHPFIWSHVSGLMQFHNGSNKGTASNFCANLGKHAMETLSLIRQAFEEESLSFQQKSPDSPRPKKVRQAKSKVKSTQHSL
jgi:hypothetical protein